MRSYLRDAWSVLVGMTWLSRAAVGSVYSHWALGLFSVVAAFGIWFAVQDIENPRAEAVVPNEGEQRIRVEAVNVPDGYIVLEEPRVSVRVRARKDDIPSLRAADFRATVDVQQTGREDTINLAVEVESQRDNVKVLEVSPATVTVTLVRAATKDVQVQIVPTGSLPDGYRRIAEQDVIDPSFVSISGLPESVASVNEVVAIVSLNGLKDESTTLDVDLIARTETGNVVGVMMSRERAKVTIHVEQLTSRRTLTLTPIITGAPAAGYYVSDIKIDPPSVSVVGPKSVMDSLTALSLEAVDISGASSQRTVTRTIEKPPNVTVDRTTVTVRIEVKPLACGGTVAGPCGSVLVVLPLALPDDLPAGLALDAGVYMVTARISGPPATLAALKDLTGFKASVSFVGANAGTASFNPKVTGPAGVTIEAVDPITLKIVPLAAP